MYKYLHGIVFAARRNCVSGGLAIRLILIKAYCPRLSVRTALFIIYPYGLRSGSLLPDKNRSVIYDCFFALALQVFLKFFEKFF